MSEDRELVRFGALRLFLLSIRLSPSDSRADNPDDREPVLLYALLPFWLSSTSSRSVCVSDVMDIDFLRAIATSGSVRPCRGLVASRLGASVEPEMDLLREILVVWRS